MGTSPKYLQKTDSGFKIVGNRGNRQLGITFSNKKENLKLTHKWVDTVHHVGNKWGELDNDSQKYRRVVDHWNADLDLHRTNAETKSNFSAFWSYVDAQIDALNVVVSVWNAQFDGMENPPLKREFSRTEPLCKKLYPSFLAGQSINVKQIVFDLQLETADIE